MRVLPKINLYSYGKPSRLWQPVLAEYESRLTRVTDFKHHIIKEPNATPDKVPQVAAKELGAKLREKAHIIVLDETGKHTTSKQLANKLHELQSQPVTFVIGTSYGLDLSQLPQHECLRLSDFVLPHELARITLLEQLYRAHAILTGHPYHHS